MSKVQSCKPGQRTTCRLWYGSLYVMHRVYTTECGHHARLMLGSSQKHRFQTLWRLRRLLSSWSIQPEKTSGGTCASLLPYCGLDIPGGHPRGCGAKLRDRGGRRPCRASPRPVVFPDDVETMSRGTERLRTTGKTRTLAHHQEDDHRVLPSQWKKSASGRLPIGPYRKASARPTGTR